MNTQRADLETLYHYLEDQALVSKLDYATPTSLKALLSDGEHTQPVVATLRDGWARIFSPLLSSRELINGRPNKIWFELGNSQLGRMFLAAGGLWFEVSLPAAALSSPCLPFALQRCLMWIGQGAPALAAKRAYLKVEETAPLLGAPTPREGALRSRDDLELALREAGETPRWSASSQTWALDDLQLEQPYGVSARWREDSSVFELRCDLTTLSYLSPNIGIARQIFTFNELLGAGRLVNEGKHQQPLHEKRVFSSFFGGGDSGPLEVDPSPPVSLYLSVPRFEGLELAPWLYRLRDDAAAAATLLWAQGRPSGEALRAELTWLREAAVAEQVQDVQILAALLTKLDGGQPPSLGRSIRWRIFIDVAAGLLNVMSQRRPDVLAQLALKHSEESFGTRTIAILEELAAHLN